VADLLNHVDNLTAGLRDIAPDRAKAIVTAFGVAAGFLIAAGKLIDGVASLRRGRRRSLAAQQRLEQATKATAFWDSWFKVQQLVNSPQKVEMAKARVRSELDALLQSLESPPTHLQAERQHPRRGFLRRLFLLHRPGSVAEWFFHILFYIFMLLLFFYFLGVSIDPETNNFSLGYFWRHLNQSLAPSLVWIIPLVLFRLGDRWAQRRQQVRSSPRADGS